MYKIYFFQQPDVLTNLIKLVETDKITLQMFEYVTQLLRSISQFNISDQNSDKYNLTSRIGEYLPEGTTELSFKLVNQQDDRKFTQMSNVGCKLIKDNLKQILHSLSIFTNNIYSSKKLPNLTKSQMKRINILMSEFSMFIAYFCESNNEETQKFISIVTKFWDVQKFNKTTDIP